MLKNCEEIDQVDALRIRNQAAKLLDELLTERQAAEQRLHEAGKRDLIKSITGQSSIEQAIQKTREMIRNMDALLRQMNHELTRTAECEAEEPVLVGAGADDGQ